jgi:hypothetical protein
LTLTTGFTASTTRRPSTALTIQLKPETPPGTYRLEVGLYDPATFARLPVSDAQGQSLGDRVLLDTPLEVVQ